MLPNLVMPAHHDIRPKDVMLRRLHGTLAAAADQGPQDFTELLMLPGVGARTVKSLAQVAEVIHGAPYRFADPARFAMAHGGKDGHPFPVPLKVYDETIRVLKYAVAKARLGSTEELAAIKRLDAQARALERTATGPSLPAFIAEERRRAPEYGGRTVFDDVADMRRAEGRLRNAPRRADVCRAWLTTTSISGRSARASSTSASTCSGCSRKRPSGTCRG